MKKVTIITAFIAVVAVQPALSRVFFAGSNPQMTAFAFPQDIWLVPQDFAFYMTTWQVLPWWGDIDEPDLRPSTTYLITGEKVGVRGSNKYFLHNAYLSNWENMAGFSKTLSDLIKLRFDFEYSCVPLSAKAEGAMFDTKGNRLRFNYSESHSIHDVYFTSYFATKWREIPLGFKLGFGRQTGLSPDCEWEIRKNDTVYSSNRNVWAWSTMLHGDNLFGNNGYDSSYHTYAHFQDDYTVGSLTRFDMQLATTLSRLKVGTRLRFNRGNLDAFDWKSDTASTWADSSLRANFAGGYAKTHSKEISENAIRLYGNYTWIEGKKYRFNTLALTRYTVNDSIEVHPENSDVKSGRKDRAGTFVFQVNPNVNIYPWNNKFTYIDLAILCNYSHVNYDHRWRHWVSGGGQKESWVNSSLGWEKDDYVWNDFSYARQNFFEIALDANPTFPIYGNRNQAVAMSVSMLLWTRFKWINKYYGRFNSSTAEFEVQNIRKNFERETWLNSVWNIIYKRDAWVYRIIFGQPLTYSLAPVTRRYEADGKTLIDQIKHDNFWVSQSGAQIGFFVSSTIEALGQLGTSFGKPK